MLLFCYFSCSHQNQGSDLQQGGEVVHELLFYYIYFFKGKKNESLEAKSEVLSSLEYYFYISYFILFGGVKKFKSSVKSNKKIDK